MGSEGGKERESGEAGRGGQRQGERHGGREVEVGVRVWGVRRGRGGDGDRERGTEGGREGAFEKNFSKKAHPYTP